MITQTISPYFLRPPSDIEVVMAEPEAPEADVGVIIGRFQAPELHKGYQSIFQYVLKRHLRTVVLIGVGPVPATVRNPLDFETRRLMINAMYPKVTCAPLVDMKTDEAWTEQVDRIVSALSGSMSAVIYGGRDSCLKHYTGRYPTQVLESEYIVSSSENRKMEALAAYGSREFRAGYIAGVYRGFRNPIPTVDICPYYLHNGTDRMILLARKAHEQQWRFIGGFVDPGDKSLEVAASRELFEETGISRLASAMRYLGSHIIDDWRYRGEPRGILTSFFEVEMQDRVLVTGRDDIEECKWFFVSSIGYDTIVPEHRVLLSQVAYR